MQVADFGLASFYGDQSVMSTVCGTVRRPRAAQRLHITSCQCGAAPLLGSNPMSQESNDPMSQVPLLGSNEAGSMGGDSLLGPLKIIHPATQHPPASNQVDIERGRLILDWRDSTRAKICVARGTRAKICVARGTRAKICVARGTRAKRRREWRLTWLDAGAGGV